MYSHSCDLLVSGIDFAVDRFLERAQSLSNAHIWRRGDQNSFSDANLYDEDELKAIQSLGIPLREETETKETSGFSISAGDRGTLAVQCADALRLLQHHESDLRHLMTFPGIDEKRLIFSYHAGLGSHFIPAELVARAGALGIGFRFDIEQFPHDYMQRPQQ